MARRKITVRRKAHKRKSYVKDVKRGKGVKLKRIPATTVKATTYKMVDLGAVGKGKKLFTVRKGLLSKYGYSTKLPATKRRAALLKADRVYGTPRLFRMLNAQVILRKRTQPEARKVFESDRDWVEKNLLSKMEALGMTRPARQRWMSMSPSARAVAMPERK